MASLGYRTRSSLPTANSNRFALRFCLLGEAGTGKSCLFHRIKNREFRDEERDSTTERAFPAATSRTRFYESYTLTLRPDRRTKISLTIMDTGSRERFQSLTAQYYKRNHVIILVCSLDNEYFLTRLAKWYTEAQYYVEDPNVIYAVAATKCDLPSVRREVTRDALLEFAQHYNIREEHVFEVSAATGEGVDEMLNSLCEAVTEQFMRGTAGPFGSENSTERSALLANPASDNALVTVKLNQHTQLEPGEQEGGGRCHGHCACTPCTCCTCCQHSKCTIL